MNRKALREAELKAARAIVDGAKNAGRNPTSSEVQRIEAHIAEADRLEEEIKREQKGDELLAQLDGTSGRAGTANDGVLGAASTSEAVKTIADAISRKGSARVFVDRNSDFFRKSTFSSVRDEAGAVVPMDGLTEQNVYAPKESAALADVFLQQKADGPLVRWYSVDAMTGVDVVAEGALKPEMTSELGVHDAPLVKLAGRYKLTTEFMADAGPMVNELRRQALLALVRRENDLVLATLEQTSGVLVKTGTKANLLDIVAEAVGEQQSLNSVSPEVMVAHPADVAAMRKLRTGGATGDYLLDPFSASASAPFGMSLFISATLKPGTVWLTRREAAVWHRHASGVMVQVGTSGDDFDTNKVTTIVEERVLLAPTQPHLITKVSLT